MNGDVSVKTKEGMTVRIPYTTIKKIKLPSKPEESTTQVATSEKSSTTNKPTEKQIPKATPDKK